MPCKSLPHLPFLVVALIFAASVAAQVPTLDEVRIDFGKNDYRAAVQKANRTLSFTSQEPAPADKYALLMIRGESQLQLKDRIGAMGSFNSAAKCAGNVNELAVAKANALIIEKSSMGKYTPRFGSDKQPIDILSIDSRKQAMTALRAEIWSQNKSQVDVALAATTLPPIEKAFAPLSDAFFLEIGATGDAPETGKVMRDLGQHTYDLMQTEVSRYARRFDQLTLAANSSSNGDGNWGGVRRGLFSTERDEVKESAASLVKIRDRATEYRTIAGKLGGNEQRWNQLVLDINDTLASAESLYNDR